MFRPKYILLFGIVALLSSCNLLKYVPEGEYLLNNVKIKSKAPEATPDQLQAYLQQTPNNRFLGIGRAKLGFYSLSDDDTTKWKNRWLRKIGEEPVIFSEELTEKSREQLELQLGNKGYLEAKVNVDTIVKDRKISVTYNVTENEPYKIRSYNIDVADSAIYKILTHRTRSTTPKAGDLFDVDVLASERENAVARLRRRGYYYINEDAFTFEADSSNHEVDITLKIAPKYLNDSVKLSRLCETRKIGSVTIYDISHTLEQQIHPNDAELDTIEKEGFRIIRDKESSFRPKLLVYKTQIKPGSIYNENNVERTYSVLNALTAIKYVEINFREETDSTLACVVVIAPAKHHSFSVDLEGTNSAGDLGVGLGISYQNKNIFKGAETLKISAHGAYEAMGKIGNIRHTYQVGGDVTLVLPVFLVPFTSSDFKRRIGGTTEFSIGYNYQQRPEYKRNIANMGMKYVWNIKRTHFTFDLLDINYVYLPWIDDAFKQQYLKPSSSIRYSYEDHFIMRLGLGIQNSNKRKNNSSTQSFYTLRGTVSTAGNLLYGISNAIHQKKSDDGTYKILNIAYSQFVKGDFDFTYNQYLARHARLVFHGGIGVVYPYGNASIVPYEERYFSGGANSVRGWAVRSLGPGRYANKGVIDYMNQSGDIRLDLNVEARFKMFWKIYGALFVDAGNIWTIHDYEEQPGGVFKFSEFYKEIACSYGVGIRADFDYFVIRLDMGVKLYEPCGATEKDRWRTSHLTWKNDFALHFAVGYPF